MHEPRIFHNNIYIKRLYVVVHNIHPHIHFYSFTFGATLVLIQAFTVYSAYTLSYFEYKTFTL